MNKKFDFMLMRLLRRLGFEKTAWALRRLNCPVGKEALVLEVGSGGNPYPRANVLLDAYESTRERHWAPLVADRPMVLGFVEDLPFKDKAFDFVIASHVLEHSAEPKKFLSELQRVAKAGYIETPDAFMERLNPYRDHRLEVTARDGRLEINKKSNWNIDPALLNLYEAKAKKWITQSTIPSHPFDFHLRYFWSDNIEFTVINDQCDATWQPPLSERTVSNTFKRNPFRSFLLNIFRKSFSQTPRNRQIDLLSLLRCPNCQKSEFTQDTKKITCLSCHSVFFVKNNIPVMYSNKSNEACA